MLTLTEPTFPNKVGKTAMALAFTPTPDIAPVPTCPAGVTLASESVTILPKELVLVKPVTIALASASTVVEPRAEVPN